MLGLKSFCPQEVLTCSLAISPAPFSLWPWSSQISIYTLSGGVPRWWILAGLWSFPPMFWSLGLGHSVLASTGWEFCRSQISMTFGSQDWGAPIQLIWAVEKSGQWRIKGASIFLMATCGGLMTVFSSRLKGVGNYSPKRNINDRRNSEAVFIIISYVWAMDCWLVSQSVCLYWFCCSRHLTPTGLKNFLGKRPCECAVLAIKTNVFPSNGSAVMNQSPRACLDGGCHFLLALEKLRVLICVKKSIWGGEELFLKDNFGLGRLPSLDVLNSH